MSPGLARGRTLISLGNPARDTKRPKSWKSQHFGRLASDLALRHATRIPFAFFRRPSPGDGKQFPNLAQNKLAGAER
jgi:hypothetical protein